MFTALGLLVESWIIFSLATGMKAALEINSELGGNYSFSYRYNLVVWFYLSKGLFSLLKIKQLSTN